MGWATPSFHSDPGRPSSDGVGDLAESWAIDGARRVLWHNGRLPSQAVPHWAAGDVVPMLTLTLTLGAHRARRTAECCHRGC